MDSSRKRISGPQDRSTSDLRACRQDGTVKGKRLQGQKEEDGPYSKKEALVDLATRTAEPLTSDAPTVNCRHSTLNTSVNRKPTERRDVERRREPDPSRLKWLKSLNRTTLGVEKTSQHST